MLTTKTKTTTFAMNVLFAGAFKFNANITVDLLFSLFLDHERN